MRTSILRQWIKRPPRGGVAVVIDVMRFSTTLCALLSAGRRTIRVAKDPRSLLRAPDLAYSDVFSELEFRSCGRRFDNSPHQVFQSRAVRRPAYVATTTGSRAVFAASRADRVLIGCFANFNSLIRRLKRARGPVRLLPAASPTPHPGAVEDELCARAVVEALRGDRHAGEKALARLRATPRAAQFLRARPLWGQKDLAYCLALDKLPVLPGIAFPSGGGAVARVRSEAR